MTLPTPEERLLENALFAVPPTSGGATPLDIALEKSPHNENLGVLWSGLRSMVHMAAGFAVVGARPSVERVAAWVNDAAPFLIARDDRWLRWGAYDKWLATLWLTNGLTAEFLTQRAACFPADPTPNPHERLVQVIRFLDIDQFSDARALLLTVTPKPHAASTLNPHAALQVALDKLEGHEVPDQAVNQFKRLVSHLRRDFFRRTVFSEIVPWMRLYNRLFVGDTDPWKVMGWLMHDPAKSLP